MNIQDGIGTTDTGGAAGRASIVDLAEDLCNVRAKEKVFICFFGIIFFAIVYR